MDLPVSLKVMWLGNLYEPQKVEYEINEEDVLYRSQYGFREEHSTQHAIIDIVNTIWTHVYFIDLKKALDTVDDAMFSRNNKPMVFIVFTRPDTNNTNWSTYL